MRLIRFGPPLIILASLLLRGTYYPIYQHIVFILAATLFLISLTNWRSLESRIRPGFIAVWTGLLALIAFLSNLWSIIPATSASSSFIYIAYALFSFLFLLSWEETGYKMGAARVKFWLIVMAIAGTLVSLSGIAGLILKFYPWAMVVDGMIMAASSLEYPNGLAVYVLMTLAPTLYLHSIVSGDKRWIIKGLIAIQVLGILSSLSKTGFLFLAILASYMLVKHRSFVFHRRYLSLAGFSIAILLIALFIGITTIGNDIDPIKWLAFDLNPSNITSHRLATWSGSMNAWLDRPLFGWGIGAYDLVFQGYAIDSLTRHAHNIFLHAGVELGLVGIVLFLVLYAYCFRLVFLSARLKNEKDVDKTSESDLVKALAFSCLVFLLNNLWDFTFYIPAITFLFLVQVMMLLLLRRKAIL